LTFVALAGCLLADGARIEPTDGDGEDWKDLTPLRPVWTAGGAGRFIFWRARAGLVAIAVAMFPELAGYDPYVRSEADVFSLGAISQPYTNRDTARKSSDCGCSDM